MITGFGLYLLDSCRNVCGTIFATGVFISVIYLLRIFLITADGVASEKQKIFVINAWKKIKGFGSLVVIALMILSFIPDKRDLLTYVAVDVVPNAQITQKTLDVIDKKLDEYLKEDKK